MGWGRAGAKACSRGGLSLGSFPGAQLGSGTSGPAGHDGATLWPQAAAPSLLRATLGKTCRSLTCPALCPSLTDVVFHSDSAQVAQRLHFSVNLAFFLFINSSSRAFHREHCRKRCVCCCCPSNSLQDAHPVPPHPLALLAAELSVPAGSSTVLPLLIPHRGSF